jgi:hypothetical protein
MKSIFISINSERFGNCQEFGHIHFFKLNRDSYQHRSNIPAIESSAQSAKGHNKDEQNCHEAKSVMSFFPLPVMAFHFVPPKHKIIFDVVLRLENYFDSPFPEPLRRPPRIV